MATTRRLLRFAPVLLLALLASCAKQTLPPDLRAALADKELKVEMMGNSTFRGVIVSVKNESLEPTSITFPAGLLFTQPAKTGINDMVLLKPESFQLEAGASDLRLVEAYSLRYREGIPTAETIYGPADLKPCRDAKVLSFIDWLASDAGKGLLDSQDPGFETHTQRVQSVLWFITQGLNQETHVGESVDVGILNEIYNAADIETLLALFTDKEKKDLDVSDQGSVFNFVLQNVDMLAADRAELHRRLVDVFGDSAYTEIRTGFLSNFQDRMDEERIAVQDILDKVGVEGRY